MAARKKTRTKRNGSARKATRTLNQFATAARRRTKTLQHEAEVAASDAGEWLGEKATYMRKAMKAQPLLTGAIASALGLLGGWFIGRSSASER